MRGSGCYGFFQVSHAAVYIVSWSMGIAFGNENHHQIGQAALQNLNMAEVRGGDQVVVKENDESKQRKKPEQDVAPEARSTDVIGHENRFLAALLPELG